MIHTIKMEAPHNSGGFSVGRDQYEPDENGHVEVRTEHLEHARSHGFKPLNFLPIAQQAAASNPNVQRPAGAAQHPVQPGGVPVPKIELTHAEREQILADETARTGHLLSDSEKQSILAAALSSKQAYVYQQMGIEAAVSDETNPAGDPATTRRTKKA